MSKSSSHHDEDSTQGSEFRKRIFDEIQREAEEELQNSGRILNSAENSFGGSPRGNNICSNNASKISSRERSGRATREGSPAVRSGMDPMGHASYESSRLTPKYMSELNYQGNTGVSSPYQGSKKSGRSHLSGSPPPFASDSKSASKCPSSSIKSPRNFYEDSDFKPESPQYSKSHSRYTSSPGHMSECTNPIHESYGSGSKSPDRLAEISCRLSQGAANSISDLANNFPEESGQFFTSLGRASETPIRHSDNFEPPSASSHPASECSTKRFSPRSAQFSQSYGMAPSQMMPEHVSYGSEYANVNESTGRMVQYSDVSGAFSQRSPGHASECAPQFDESSNKHTPSSIRFAESSACQSEYPSSIRFAESSARQSEYPSSIRFDESSARQSEIAPNFSEHASHFSETSNRFNMSSGRFAESPGRISEPLSTIPESPGDFYGLPQPISDPYASRSSEARNGRGSKNCSEKAIKCLARLNSQSHDNWLNRSWDGENLCQYLTACDPSYKPGTADRKLPKRPELSQKELQMLINNEANDVELTKCIMADEKKTFKKPCPKQAKAKMQIKQLINSMDAPADPCPKNYGRLIEPDPEDISPDVAAAMMFSQEQGIKMESCPAETIKYLFPDEKSPCEKIPVSKLSVVDSSQKDQDHEMIEKSASLPTEGLSDSAYTRLKKEQSEDIGSKISYELDFEAAQGKREFVLVSRKSQRFNKIQYRGNDPSWFPGYLSAFPDEKGIKVVSSPSTVFNKAWMATNPGTMPLSDVTVIE